MEQAQFSDLAVSANTEDGLTVGIVTTKQGQRSVRSATSNIFSRTKYFLQLPEARLPAATAGSPGRGRGLQVVRAGAAVRPGAQHQQPPVRLQLPGQF